MSESLTYILPTLLLLSSSHHLAVHNQLQGKWEVISETWGGWQVPDDIRATELEIKGDVVTQSSMNHTDNPGKDRLETAALRLRRFDLPPALDLVDPQDQEMGYFAAIYKFEKDRLTICYVIRRSLDRPTDFTSTKDNANAVVVLKRLKSS